MENLSDQELLDALGVTVEAKKAVSHTPLEERVIAGFEDIARFVEEHGRPPQHGEDGDIFEKLYAVRLDRLREQPEFHPLLAELDVNGLLHVATTGRQIDAAELDDSELLSELGVMAPVPDDITVLKNVRPREEVRAAEEIANRKVCEDFDKFRPLFDQVQKELDAGIRQTRTFELKAEIKPGAYFIVEGQKAYVAEMEEPFTNPQGRRDARLRVIFDNGTESNMLMRSLQRALHKDEAGRRITNPSAGPLFGDAADDDDLESGTIYVLRSKSDHPDIAANRELIHKIGVTGGDVEARIAHAALDGTYLLAEVEVVATYKLFNINRTKLENLLHRVLVQARLDLTIEDRFGNPVKPKEWYLVPLSAIDEVVERIRDQSILDFMYDPQTASLKPIVATS